MEGGLFDVKYINFGSSPLLKTIKLHGVEQIGYGAFFACKQLEKITIFGGDDLVIDEWAFSIPINTTNVYEVDIRAQSSIILKNRAFLNAFESGADKKAVFSAPKISIKEQVFFACNVPVEMTFNGKVTDVGNSAFRTAYTTSYYEKLKIHYTGSVDEFKKACGGNLSSAGLQEDNFV